MSSNWSANKSPAQRERFASPIAICGLVGAGLLLLVMLYPEKTLLKLLSAPEVTSPAQQRYLEILVHLRTGDPDLAFTLIRSYLAAKHPDKAAQTLDLLRGELSPSQAKTAMALRYEVYRQCLMRLPQGDSRRPAAQKEYARQVELALQGGATPTEVGRYLSDARSVGDTATSRRLEALLQKRAGIGAGPAAGENPDVMTADAALARGDYRGAAALQFQAMKNAPRNEKRKHFLAGVRTLQSGNLPNEALTAAEAHLNDLADDRQTLVFMSRLALATNRPERAQFYIRRALGITDGGKDGA